MEVIIEICQERVNDIHEKVVERDKVEEYERIMPALFCAMRYFKDGRFLAVDKGLELKRLKNACEQKGFRVLPDTLSTWIS